MKPDLRKALSLTKRAKDAIRMPYAWPGGYPLSIFTIDGGVLCPACAKRNWQALCEGTLKPAWRGCGWCIATVDVVWEGDCVCDECGEDVTAYGNPDNGEE